MSARKFWVAWFLAACLANGTAARAQEMPQGNVRGSRVGTSAPTGDEVPDVSLKPGITGEQAPFRPGPDGPLGPQSPWFNPWEGGHLWGLSITPYRCAYVLDNLPLKGFDLGNGTYVPLFGLNNLEDNYLMGGGLAGEIPLTGVLHMTAAVDLAGTMEAESWGVPGGFHGVFSLLFNVDPLVEHIFYGAGVDVYMQPPLDRFQHPDGLRSTITGQIRGGAGVSTNYGDFVLRGGGRLGRDEELFGDPNPNNQLYFPQPDGTFLVRSRSVYFTTQHIEGGLMTNWGPLETDILFGWRSDPNLPFFYLNYRLPFAGGWSVTGDYYIDRATNYMVTLGFTFDIGGGVRDNTFRRILKPYTVGQANRMQNYELFKVKTLKDAP